MSFGTLRWVIGAEDRTHTEARGKRFDVVNLDEILIGINRIPRKEKWIEPLLQKPNHHGPKSRAESKSTIGLLYHCTIY